MQVYEQLGILRNDENIVRRKEKGKKKKQEETLT